MFFIVPSYSVVKGNVVAKNEKVKSPKKKKEETKYTLVFHAEDKNVKLFIPILSMIHIFILFLFWNSYLRECNSSQE